MKHDVLDFWKKYTLINSAKNLNLSPGSIRVCRYCKKNETQITFETTAHIIPELLGENSCICFDECDSCNQKFSSYESHLSKFFLPYLTICGVKGKSSIPEFHSRTINNNESTRTIIRTVGNTRQIKLADLNDYIIDEAKKTMTVIFRKPPHRPLWVYKALSKIGLSLIPEKEYSVFDEVSRWLLKDSEAVSYFVTTFITVLTYKKFATPFADLYKAKRILFSKSFLPEYTLVIGFGNVMVQIFLPLSSDPIIDKIKNKRPALLVYPSFVFDDLSRKKSAQISVHDLKGKETITYDHSMHFSYTTADLNIHKSNKKNKQS